MMATDHLIELAEWDVPDSQPLNGLIVKTAHLLEPPKELRLDIYEIVLISPWIIKWHGKAGSTKLTHHHLTCNVARYSPARFNFASILLVCLSIYNEAAPILYRNNTFECGLLGRRCVFLELLPMSQTRKTGFHPFPCSPKHCLDSFAVLDLTC